MEGWRRVVIYYQVGRKLYNIRKACCMSVNTCRHLHNEQGLNLLCCCLGESWGMHPPLQTSITMSRAGPSMRPSRWLLQILVLSLPYYSKCQISREARCGELPGPACCLMSPCRTWLVYDKISDGKIRLCRVDNMTLLYGQLLFL